MVHLGDESLGTIKAAIRLLESGQTVSIVGRGDSMTPMIPDGTRMILVPAKNEKLNKGDVVLASIHMDTHVFYVMHLIYVWMHDNTKALIGDNHGYLNGWAWADNIYGKYVGAIE